MALFNFITKKHKLYLISLIFMQGKLIYNKVIAKYIYYKKFYYKTIDY